MAENDEDPTQLNKSLFIFGTDIGQIPCFRESLLNGSGTGFGAGLVSFMFTSKPRLATHIGFGVFWTSTFFYWFRCRYTFAQTKFSLTQVKEALKNQALLEGTLAEAEHLKRLENEDKAKIEVASV